VLVRGAGIRGNPATKGGAAQSACSPTSLGTAWTARNLRWRGSSTEPADIRSEVALSVALAQRVVAAGDPPRTVGPGPGRKLNKVDRLLGVHGSRTGPNGARGEPRIRSE